MTKFRMLDLCLDRINKTGESDSIGVTLLIGSMAIVGDLIHPVAYYKAMQSALSGKYGPAEDGTKKPKLSKSAPKETNEIFLKNVTIWRMPAKNIDGPIAISIDSIGAFIFCKLDFSSKLPPMPATEIGLPRIPF